MKNQLFAALEVYHDVSFRSAAMNMAIDEALLESAQVPSIRFYQWASPALSFGYFGKFADVAVYAGERALVRRWTGGGIVLHGEDLTYSLIIPASERAFAEPSMSIYQKVHGALRDALSGNGESAELVTLGGDAALRRPQTSQRDVSTKACFAHPVRADVMLNGRKIAGAAQRRTRAGLLHQGSIQDVDLANGLAEEFAQALSARCERREIESQSLERADEIAAQKYATSAWLQKR